MKTNRIPACCAIPFSAFVLALSVALPVQSDEASVESERRLLTDIKYLSSDELEGRGVGLKGLDLAADYIRDQFLRAGLKVDAVAGGAYQVFQMNTGAEMGPVNTLELAGPSEKRFDL